MFTIFWRKIFLKNGNKKRVSVKTCLRMQVDPVNSCCLCLVWVKFWSQLSWSSEFSIFFYVSSLSIRIMELLTPDILLSCQKLYMLSFQIHVQSCFKNFIHTEVVVCVCVCVYVCVCVCVWTPLRICQNQWVLCPQMFTQMHLNKNEHIV